MKSGTYPCCGGYAEHFDGCSAVRPTLFWDKVNVVAGECWEWTGYRTAAGYGQYKRNLLAHRVAFELTNGPVPDGLQIDHLCRNRGCVNPDHLEAVTQAENIRRGQGSGFRLNAAKVACPSGHAYSAENTYIDPQGRRHCRTCDNAAKQAYAARKRAERDGLEATLRHRGVVAEVDHARPGVDWNPAYEARAEAQR